MVLSSISGLSGPFSHGVHMGGSAIAKPFTLSFVLAVALAWACLLLARVSFRALFFVGYFASVVAGRLYVFLCHFAVFLRP